MLDISLAELLLIVVVAVIFIGPKELPHVIRGLAKAMRAMKSVTNEIKKTWDDIADSPEIKMIQGDDGKWYEAYPISSPIRGEVGRGASTLSPETFEQECPHPYPPPTGEGV